MAQSEVPREGAGAPRYLPLLILLFAGSGCSALIYEIVWFQLLQLAIGSTAVSLGVLLATYMGGLCLGSLWLPRLRLKPAPASGVRGAGGGYRGLRLLVLGCIPLVNRVYVAGAAYGLPGMLLRGAVLRRLPAAAHGADGGVFAGHRALDRVHAARRFVVGHVVRREHGRGGIRVPARGLLYPSHLQHGYGHVRGGGD